MSGSRSERDAVRDLVAARIASPGADRDPERAYRRELRRYERMLGRARTAVFTGLVVVVATAVAAVAGPQPWWLVVTAGGAWLAATSWVRLRRSRPPQRPPAALVLGELGRSYPTSSGWVGAVVGRMVGGGPAGPRPTVGAAEIDRLAVAEDHLARLLPAVERLHPSAGHEMRQAIAETGPLLHQQVERLGVLDRLARDLAQARAGEAARTAATQVAARLSAGVDAYERLLAAAATLLGAPDVGRSADEVLGPAVDGLTAYAHGLAAAEASWETFPPPDPAPRDLA